MGRIEQRLAARFNVEVAAEVYTPGQVLAATTRNLSNTGVCLEINSGLEEGSIVGISLFFTADGIEDPDSEPLNVKASVIWCAQKDDANYSAGACFESLTDDDKSLLGEFLAALGR
jgi:hypothetical protein